MRKKVLYISGSQREGNCYKLATDIMDDRDILFALSEKDVRLCYGCNKCIDMPKKYCAIKDDMFELYKYIEKCEKIVMIIPIYFETISGSVKNLIDRLMPVYLRETLKGKKLYLITVGEQSEEENEETTNRIYEYFKCLENDFGFETIYLKNFSSCVDDDVESSYENYDEILDYIIDEIESE